MLLQPPTTGRQVAGMLGLSGNAGKTNILLKFVDETGLVLLQVVEDSVHEVKGRRLGENR